MPDDPDDVLDAVLDALETALDDTGDPVATAPEIADSLPFDRERRRVLDDLRTLERAGEAASKKAGANARVWWPTPTRAPEPPDSRSTPPARTHTPERDADPVRDRDGDHVSGRASIRELANTVDVPGTTEAVVDDRRDAVAAALEYLRDHGVAYRSDFQADVYPEHPARYETEGGWWNAVQPALRELAARDERLEAAGTRSPWRWREN